MLLGDKVYANKNSRLAQVSKHSDFDVIETLEVRTSTAYKKALQKIKNEN